LILNFADLLAKLGMDWRGNGVELALHGLSVSDSVGGDARVSIEKSISPYTRVQRVKGLDVFCENLRRIILGEQISKVLELGV
jgi:hypothetical protein